MTEAWGNLSQQDSSPQSSCLHHASVTVEPRCGSQYLPFHVFRIASTSD
jgi:hypothetical protein